MEALFALCVAVAPTLVAARCWTPTNMPSVSTCYMRNARDQSNARDAGGWENSVYFASVVTAAACLVGLASRHGRSVVFASVAAAALLILQLAVPKSDTSRLQDRVHDVLAMASFVAVCWTLVGVTRETRHRPGSAMRSALLWTGAGCIAAFVAAAEGADLVPALRDLQWYRAAYETRGLLEITAFWAAAGWALTLT